MTDHDNSAAENWPDEPWWRLRQSELLAFGRGFPVGAGAGYLDGAGVPVPTDPPDNAELYVTCRMTYVYSLAYMDGDADALPLVAHGLASLDGPLRDDHYGGWFAAATPQVAVNTAKEAYGHAFVLLATASACATGLPQARELLNAAVDVFERHFWDDEAGMTVESWDREWSECEDYRGVNANMHATEAFFAVALATGDDVWRQRALRILRRVIAWAHEYDGRLPEHFTGQWQPQLDYNHDMPAHPFRPYGATVGHWFEWARLALQAYTSERELGRAGDAEWLLEGATFLYDAAVRDGWSVDGAPGFVYTVDFKGKPVVRQRMHWVAAEAVGAAAALRIATGDPRYAKDEATWWRYIVTHMIDGSGSWIHELDEANSPSGTVWPGKPDLYHAVQATMVPRLPLWPPLAFALAATGESAQSK
ncbi:AGE family epimerase/isomerase [Demequina sediminicola]|uniref:AGE family epimerase/isomerase n=1 Tax=Demequina sediminicola TaxID=1095026 RepID=UPI0009E54977|nr:AGE family epimerase/isomerase [Demequina sediminicola]